MKRWIIGLIMILSCSGIALEGCGEEGKEGTTAINCGAHGTEHDGHCHCDQGYLFNEESCVTPDQITEECMAEGEHSEEHQHGACLCPTQGVCPCDDGEVETYDSKQYCIPELHHD